MEDLWLMLLAVGTGMAAAAVIAGLLWIAILLHELGHALLAWLCRFKNFQFYVGSGRPAVTFRLGGAQIHLAPLPAAGLIIYFPLRLGWYRLRALAALSGGPLANAITCVVGFWIAENLPDSSGPVQKIAEFLVLVLSYFSGGLVIASVLPYTSRVFGGRIESDGLQILRLLFTKEDFSEATYHFSLAQGSRYYEEKQLRRAARWIKRALRHPTIRGNAMTSAACASLLEEAGHIDHAHQLLSDLLEQMQSEPPTPMRREVADSFGSLAIYHNRPDWLPGAERALRAAVADFPSEVTLRGTLGGILFELGKTDEAETLLLEVFTTSTAPIDRSISAAYLAGLWESRGDRLKASEYREQALREAPDSGGAQHLVTRLTRRSAPRDTPAPTPA